MPLSEELITNFTSILDRVVAAAVANANKLTNLNMSSKINKYGDSFVQDSQVQVEQESPLFQIFNSINADDPILVLTQVDTAALIADKMMGQEAGEPVFSEDKHEAYSNALMQSAQSAVSSFSELTSAAFELKDSKLSIVNPENEESLTLEVDPDRYLFEVEISIEGMDQKTVYLDFSTKNINSLLALFPSGDEAAASPETGDAQEGQETVGDFMGTDFAEIMDSHDPLDVDTAKNLNLLMDIRLGLIVELGRSEMHLRDILQLTKGSIVELDRLSGEPVDLFVNNKLIARGEVVVIDDNFGLRISQLAGNSAKEKRLIGAQE